MAVNPDKPFRGYRRLTFLKFKVWQVLLIIGLIGVLSILVFPKDRILISLYLERGMYEEASQVVSQMRGARSGDLELILLSGNISEMKGDLPEAIETLEQAAVDYPDNPNILLKLAGYYEDSRRLKDAASLWEALMTVDPLNIDITAKLIDYYRYYNIKDKESLSIIHHVNIEQALPADRIISCSDDPLKIDAIMSHRLYKALSWALRSLLKKEQLPQFNDPYLHELLSGIFLRRASLVADLCSHDATYKIATGQDVEKVLQLFVEAGKIDTGILFARHLDETWEMDIDNRLLFARLLRENGRTDAAGKALAALQEEFPGNTAITAELKTVRTAERQPPDAVTPAPIDVYAELKRLLSGTEQTDRTSSAILDLLASIVTDRKTVADTLSRLLKGRPRTIPILERIAQLYLWIEQPDRAYYVYRDIVALEPGRRSHLLTMLDTAENTGNTKIVSDAAQSARRTYPKDSAILLRAAGMFLAAGNQDEAIATYNAYLRFRPQDREIQRKVVQLYMWNEQPETAKKRLAVMIAAQSGNRQSLLSLAGFAESVGLTDSAAAIYEELATRYPDDPAIAAKLASVAAVAPAVVESARSLAEESDRDPGNFAKAVRAGEASVAADQLSSGIPYLERALSLRPDDTELRKKIAQYYTWTGDTDKLLEQLQYLHKRGLLDEAGRITLAQAYLDGDNGAGALEILKTFEGTSPLPLREGIMLARSYELSGSVDGAVRIYRQLAQEHGDDTEQLATLGNYALWLDQIDLAQDIYESVLRKDPRNLTALKGSAQTYAWNNDPQRAIERFEAYNRINPDDFEVRYQLGELYFQNGRQGDAFKEYQIAEELMKKAESLKE